MKILIACEFSQIVTKVFRENGHEAVSCDLLPTEGNPDWHIRDDVLKHLDDGWDMMIAFPPCTFLAVSGNKWMKPEFRHRFPDRPEQRKEAMDFFMKLVNAPIKKIAIENPIGIMSTHYRKPDQIIQPWQYGHREIKATSLWLKGLPNLIPTKIVTPEWIIGKTDGKKYSRIHYMTAGSFGKDINRKRDRSRTYPGIAEAMADQWGF